MKECNAVCKSSDVPEASVTNIDELEMGCNYKLRRMMIGRKNELR